MNRGSQNVRSASGEDHLRMPSMTAGVATARTPGEALADHCEPEPVVTVAVGDIHRGQILSSGRHPVSHRHPLLDRHERVDQDGVLPARDKGGRYEGFVAFPRCR